MSKDLGGAAFVGLIDLAAEEMGGRALASSDDFFAGMENMLKPGRGVFLPDEYTDRGKWMDGWESRRKRGPGHDWCLVRLGVRGVIKAVDIDTNHFLGNHPPYASLEATRAPLDADVAGLEAADWTEILPQSPLRPGSQNLFVVSSSEAYTHLRLRIYPDGGVARLKVWGSADPDWDRTEIDDETRPRLRAGVVVLAGSRVGLGAVIGAGAVVRGEVAPRSVVAGVPARDLAGRGTPGIRQAEPRVAADGESSDRTEAQRAGLPGESAEESAESL
jgi:allantoicase